MVLWLSHLMLIPFDLASVDSSEEDDGLTSPDLFASIQLPRIAESLALLGIQYLDSSSKEREAAKILLVRLALRTDMHKINLDTTLVHAGE